jgi:hypothetical protein
MSTEELTGRLVVMEEDHALDDEDDSGQCLLTRDALCTRGAAAALAVITVREKGAMTSARLGMIRTTPVAPSVTTSCATAARKGIGHQSAGRRSPPSQDRRRPIDVTPGGCRFFLLLIDDFGRIMLMVQLTSKDEATTTLMQFQAEA